MRPPERSLASDSDLPLVLRRLYDALAEHFGPTGWWPAETPFEVCVGAILTQNAPWSGVARSIDALKSRGLLSPAAIVEAHPAALAESIRSSIYYNQKAKRLQAFCRFLIDMFDGDIAGMAALETDAARAMLLALPGIGRETADSILCYALGRPVFVIDAYTRRILGRHRLADPALDYDILRRMFEDAFPPDAQFYGEFHALLCLTGARYCRRKPLCDHCPVRPLLGDPVL